MIRRYVDLSGRPRILKKIGGGGFIHWHRDHSACWSTIWEDLENGEHLQIPNNAWEKLKMPFADSNDDEGASA